MRLAKKKDVSEAPEPQEAQELNLKLTRSVEAWETKFSTCVNLSDDQRPCQACPYFERQTIKMLDASGELHALPATFCDLLEALMKKVQEQE
jgi:hypothetical protein